MSEACKHCGEYIHDCTCEATREIKTLTTQLKGLKDALIWIENQCTCSSTRPERNCSAVAQRAIKDLEKTK